MTTPVADSARFMATHIALKLTATEEEELRENIVVPRAAPNAAKRLTAIVPMVDEADIAHLNVDKYVRHIFLDNHTTRVSVENTMLKHQLYDRKTNRPMHLPPTDVLCRRLSAIGFRHYENHFSKVIIRTSVPLRATISIHTSGKVLVTGTENLDTARYQACEYVARNLLPQLDLPGLEARDESLSNVVVKVETAYTFSLRLMARTEEEVTYETARFSSAMLKNQGVARSLDAGMAITDQSVAAMLGRRFREPTLPRHRWAILFFKPNRVLIVGLRRMEDIESMTRIAHAIAFPYRYELPENRVAEDALEASYSKKRSRSTASDPNHRTAKRRRR